MDYILATFFAVMAATVYSAFALFINAGGRRPAYRIVMWGYIAALFAATVSTIMLNLPTAYLMFGSLISGILGVFVQMAVAAKLGHLRPVESPDRIDWDRFSTRNISVIDSRNITNPSYFGPYDPHRKHW
ncbi:hypothetical protein [Burkholderia glumae]|uniref:hypothetical protein n=2 Tax=Burkholderia glumae TaxID=337 RepID=UPI0001A4A4DD|nr:hypothetical protein [Burkholderia glumae]ACR32793.1 Hypothetical protein bglu_3p0170 [Burkholderia glumae BGR1]MCR1770712.1 hypothetical protein [Burkholderia glumae]QHP94967.1 hypothetical protein EXE55_29135 [Burkholderia glumae]UVT05877.1 hypothetical protein EFP20_29945 [Burkholderia glumae]